MHASLVLFLLLLATPVLAETPNAAPAAPSADELQQLVETLQDDKARAQFVAELQTLIAVRRVSAVQSETTSPAGWLSQRVDQLTSEVLDGVSVVVDAPRIVAWGRSQVEDDAARRRWLEIGLALVVVFGCAAAAEWLVRRFLLRLLPRAPTRRDTRGVRLLFALVELVIGALPIIAFAAVAYVVLPVTLPPYSAGRTSLALLVHATVVARLILTLANSLLLASDAGIGTVSEETRNYLYIWIKRFTCWGVFGLALAEGAWWLGIPGGVHALMLKGVALVLAILAIVFVLQNRAAVSEWIAGPSELPEDARAAGWRRLRRRLAETWHILAIIYILGIFVVYALQVAGGFIYLLRATALSLVAIVGARLLMRFAERASARGFAIAPDLRTRFPTLEQRANRYLPILTGLVRALVYLVALLVVLQAWDIGSFAWFDTELGRKVTGIALSVATVLGIALAVWEIFSAAIERHLSTLAATPSSRTRLRTLLPLLRTAMLCIIVVMAALIVLSQIGINIAPLLAGAGVVGLAIGFGSQALVKDIITGLFILIEDQIAVGDIVDVGKDHKGTVEAISIRTIRLRDQAGVVHTVPFSEVTSIKNLTKDFAYAVARIGISYAEDIDRVVEILRAASEELMADEAVAPFVLDPFNYQGVDSLDDLAVVLLVRIRTMPGKHLVVGRAFNRLVKMAFEKHGIVGRDPSPMIFTGPALNLPDVASGGSETSMPPTPVDQRRRA